MTFDDFKEALNRKNAFDKYWHYSLAIVVGLFCVVGLFYITFVDTEKSRSFGIAAYLSLLLLLAMSFSAYRLLPNRYKIVEIPSLLSLKEKHDLISGFLSDYCGIPYSKSQEYISGYLKRKWWQTTFQLHFYFDEHRFAFSLQGHDWRGGWIDFGQTEKERQRIRREIEKLTFL